MTDNKHVTAVEMKFKLYINRNNFSSKPFGNKNLWRKRLHSNSNKFW